MADELSAPLGRRKRKNTEPRPRGRLRLPLARIAFALLGLVLVGTVLRIVLVSDPQGGRPSAEVPINSTPLAPSPSPPEPLDEPAMRSLLSKVGAVHPLKVKAITDLLESHGGKRRLSECDPSTWPAIAEEAQKVLAEYSV